jgi:mRNA-degrading endonuclease RelE of RelBE toxin-antitoxin system
MRYSITFSPEAAAHLQALSAYQRAAVLDAVGVQLGDEPLRPTRMRKALRSTPLARWQLRIGDIRVYYNVDEAAESVRIAAVGVKRGNRLTIGGREFQL